MKDHDVIQDLIARLGDYSKEFFANLKRLHTTPLGAERIRRNLSLEIDDVVAWCRHLFKSKKIYVLKNGKNWYVETDDYRFTINASTYTIITAHPYI